MQVKVYREIPVRIWESLSVTVEVNLRCHDNVILHSLSRKRIFLAPNMFLYRHMLQNNQQSVVYSTWTMDFMGSWTPRIQDPITPSNTVFFLFCFVLLFHGKSQEQPLSGTENSHLAFSTQRAWLSIHVKTTLSWRCIAVMYIFSGGLSL